MTENMSYVQYLYIYIYLANLIITDHSFYTAQLKAIIWFPGASVRMQRQLSAWFQKGSPSPRACLLLWLCTMLQRQNKQPDRWAKANQFKYQILKKLFIIECWKISTPLITVFISCRFNRVHVLSGRLLVKPKQNSLHPEEGGVLDLRFFGYSPDSDFCSGGLLHDTRLCSLLLSQKHSHRSCEQLWTQLLYPVLAHSVFPLLPGVCWRTNLLVLHAASHCLQHHIFTLLFLHSGKNSGRVGCFHCHQARRQHHEVVGV